MNIVVCVKQTPEVVDAELEVARDGRDIDREDLEFDINEWDNYALEEAVLLKEKFAGDVTAVTVGDKEDEGVLRRCLAMGADRAIRIDPGGIILDAFSCSRILSEVIKGLSYDLVFTGVQADDFNDGAVGIMLAEHLGVAHAAVVRGLDPEDGGAILRVELEGGMDEVVHIPFPAVLSIQTGINVPRYVSIMGIRKAAKKELKVLEVEQLGIPDPDLSPRITVEKVYLPPETEGAEILEGDPGTVAGKILQIIKEKGVNI